MKALIIDDEPDAVEALHLTLMETCPEVVVAGKYTVPEKGLANAALIRVMAKMLDEAARHITLEAGDTSRLKRLRIRDMGHAIARVEARLKTS